MVDLYEQLMPLKLIKKKKKKKTNAFEMCAFSELKYFKMGESVCR